MTEAGSKSGAKEDLSSVAEALRQRFVSERRVLSFGEYLGLVREDPTRHTRDAARYLRDTIDHFGVTEVTRGGRPTPRFRLFDLPFDAAGTARRDALVGHEDIQAAFYRALSNFVREGRVNRLVMLHGPNGSAKSTFVNCLMRGLEAYSASDEGAIYYFSWIFPRGKDGRAIGFGSTDDTLRSAESFAHLPDAQIDLRMVSELRENPLLLLPASHRRTFLDDVLRGKDEKVSKLVGEGQLGAKNQQIFEALMTAYRGDLLRVLAHVRVERFYVSHRYRHGAVTVGPQMAVDAQERQITMDRSLSALPASLSSLSLFETHGDLVEASNGIIEFSDLLKRPFDAWRYLLLAVEEGEVALSTSVLPLNTVFVATSNDIHLKAFREHHEYRSFRGRLSLVRVPYLVDYRREQSIYDAQIAPELRGHVTPHATYVAALWAVLTRLRKPQADSYESKKVAQLVLTLTPLEKAELYADGVVPGRFANDEAAELRAAWELIRHESDTWPNYEGGSGASAREVRLLLLDAAQDATYRGLSPLAVLKRIRELCEHEDYDFLKETPQGGYHDHRAFVEVVHQRWLDRVDAEFRRATGLVEESQYLDLFDRYVTHVSYSLKKERVPNPLTGKDELADTGLMATVEQMLGAKNGESFRKDLISGVAAYAIDHPGEKVVYARVFPRYIEQLREATFGARRKQLAEIATDVVRIVSEPKTHGLDAERLRRAERTLRTMIEHDGYVEHSVRDVLDELVERRYRG